tara:strand:+ start:321 stop:518 length:198 start_codon:yes stop_codon:yes gene_type:complete
MVINLWHNSAMDQWRWTLSDPKTLDQYSGTQEDIRVAMDDIANTVEYLIKEKNIDMELEIRDYIK